MEHSFKRVTKRVFGIRDFRYLKLGIRDLKAKSGRDSGLKVCARGGMPKIALGITGLHEILGRDYGIEEPYWGPSFNPHNFDNHQLFLRKEVKSWFQCAYYQRPLDLRASTTTSEGSYALSRSQNDKTSNIWYLVFATTTFALILVVEWRRLPHFPAKWRWFTREHYVVLRKPRTRSRTRLRI